MQQALSRRLLAPWFVLLHIRCTTSGGTSDHWRSWSHCFSSTDTSASISSSSCCNYSNAAALATCIREQRLEWAWSSDNFRNMNSPCSSPITDNERAPRGALLQWNEHESGDDAIEAANAEFARLFRRDYHVVPPGDDFYHEGYFRGEVVHSLARAYTYVWVLPAGTVLVDSTEDWFATMEAMGSNNTWIGSSGPELDGSPVPILGFPRQHASSIQESRDATAAVATAKTLGARSLDDARFAISLRSQLRRSGTSNNVARRVERAQVQRIFASCCAAIAAATPNFNCRPVFSRRLRLHVCAPSAAIVGVPKAATTSIFSHLLQHPRLSGPVNVASQKETHWFGSPFGDVPIRNASSALTYFQEYLDLFELQPVLRLAGARFPLFTMAMEASPGYLFTESASLWLSRYLPHMKIVIMLRSPGERALSDFRSRTVEGTVARYLPKGFGDEAGQTSFEALANQARSALQECPSRDGLYSITDRSTTLGCFVNPFFLFGCYARYLRRWFNTIPRGKLWIEDVTTLHSNPVKLTTDLAQFLDLQTNSTPFKFDLRYAFNSGDKQGIQAMTTGQGLELAQSLRPSSLRSLSRRTRCDVATFFRPFNKDLTDLFEQEGIPVASFPWLVNTGEKEETDDCSSMDVVIDGRNGEGHILYQRNGPSELER
jgi:hypothetical protein